MNATQIITALQFAEVNGSLSGDTRRMMREEREALTTAVQSEDGARIKEAMAEAQRVAKMWGVSLAK